MSYVLVCLRLGPAGPVLSPPFLPFPRGRNRFTLAVPGPEHAYGSYLHRLSKHPHMRGAFQAVKVQGGNHSHTPFLDPFVLLLPHESLPGPRELDIQQTLWYCIKMDAEGQSGRYLSQGTPEPGHKGLGCTPRATSTCKSRDSPLHSVHLYSQ